MTATQPLFNRVAIIGIGLIGSSLALAMRAAGLAGRIVCADAQKKHVAMALELELVDMATTDERMAVEDADLVVLATPVGAFEDIVRSIAPALAKGCIVTDVGSVKRAVVDRLTPLLPDHVCFIPGHPIAGTEDSGPEAGFAELFQGRWHILTPGDDVDALALDRLRALWTRCGAHVGVMSADEHDRVLALTSHVPHMLAFSLMGAADHLSQAIDKDVIGYSAGTFRDMTRVAASDPVMWRDIFLNNKAAVLDILDLILAEVDSLRRAVDRGDGAALIETITQARALRRGLKGPQINPPDVIVSS